MSAQHFADALERLLAAVDTYPDGPYADNEKHYQELRSLHAAAQIAALNGIKLPPLEEAGLRVNEVLRTRAKADGEPTIVPIFKARRYGDSEAKQKWLEDICALREGARFAMLPEQAKKQESRMSKEPMFSLGYRNYAVGQETQAVDENEDTVLQAFFQRARSRPGWIALDQDSLRNESGYQTAPRILKGIKDKYPAFASVIDCPGKKGRGGLKIYAASSKKTRKK